MPTYDYRCRDCKVAEEHVHSMHDVLDIEHQCPKCDKPMSRIISGGLATIFRGSWVDKDLRRKREDAKIEEARQKAGRLKDSGAVPWDEQIKIDGAAGMYDRLGSEMRKKEAKKAESGKLDKEMDGLVTSE